MRRKKSILKLIKSHEIALRYMKICKQSCKSKGFNDYMFDLEEKKKHIENLRNIKNNCKKQVSNMRKI